VSKSITGPFMQMYAPHLVALGEGVTAAVFPLMKIYPAELCVRRALEGFDFLNPPLIIESSSGTMALALALVCNWLRLRLTIVTDYACDDVLKRRMEDLGAAVKRVTAPAASGGYQRSRLDLLHRIRQETPDTCWVNQYDNPCNPGAYSVLAGQLVEALGKVDCLVGAVGSGGSICGTGAYLRTLFPDLIVIGVDTFNSVLFGQPDGVRKLRGLGNSLLPKNLDHTQIDEVHWVSAAEAYTATRILHRKCGLFRGGTSGAAWLVARHWAQKNPGKQVVCLMPDDGHRYVHDIYDDAFLNQNGLWLSELPAAPRIVSRPEDAGPVWSAFEWGRRSFQEIAPEIARVLT
jgi:S-sulfo-L-cysteine synthase (3-phospho-L-serine-dependent)